MLLNLTVGLLTFAALAFLGVWALRGMGRPAEARIRELAVAKQHGGIAGVPFQRRVVLPAVESMGRWVANVLPGAFSDRTERRLVLAGQPMRTTTFFALMLTMGAISAGLYLLLVFSAMNGRPSIIALMPTVVFFVAGMFIVSFWLSIQAKSRQTAMLRGLPDSMDLLTICVEAGLGLDAAFHRVAEKQSGPLVDEIRQMLREIGFGKTRREALLDLTDRTQIDDVRVFANSIVQAEQLGTSIAQVLRAQAQRMRIRRRQRAEQEARRAPVKMIFPLVLCFMPSLFIFILGPIILTFVQYLQGRS